MTLVASIIPSYLSRLRSQQVERSVLLCRICAVDSQVEKCRAEAGEDEGEYRQEALVYQKQREKHRECGQNPFDRTAQVLSPAHAGREKEA